MAKIKKIKKEDSFALKLQIGLEDDRLIQDLCLILNQTSHKLPTKK